MPAEACCIVATGTFADLARKAAGNAEVQGNLLSLIEAIEAGLGEGIYGLGAATPRHLVRNRDLIEPLWRGALASPIQAWRRGWIADLRTKLVMAGAPEDAVLLPEWARVGSLVAE
jgi:hypothetical protein